MGTSFEDEKSFNEILRSRKVRLKALEEFTGSTTMQKSYSENPIS